MTCCRFDETVEVLAFHELHHESADAVRLFQPMNMSDVRWWSDASTGASR